jgi:hypothetical protein
MRIRNHWDEKLLCPDFLLLYIHNFPGLCCLFAVVAMQLIILVLYHKNRIIPFISWASFGNYFFFDNNIYVVFDLLHNIVDYSWTLPCSFIFYFFGNNGGGGAFICLAKLACFITLYPWECHWFLWAIQHDSVLSAHHCCSINIENTHTLFFK